MTKITLLKWKNFRKITDGQRLKTTGHLMNLIKLLKYGVEIDRQSCVFLTGGKMLILKLQKILTSRSVEKRLITPNTANKRCEPLFLDSI
jgi:hypothetical protein